MCGGIRTVKQDHGHKFWPILFLVFSRQCSEEQGDEVELAQGETGCSLLPL